MLTFFCSFDRICRQQLNMGIQKVEHVQSQYLKKLKAQLPRRESARRNHPFARHCDILTAIDTRYSSFFLEIWLKWLVIHGLHGLFHVKKAQT